jgi:hypothetical protein
LLKNSPCTALHRLTLNRSGNVSATYINADSASGASSDSRARNRSGAKTGTHQDACKSYGDTTGASNRPFMASAAMP